MADLEYKTIEEAYEAAETFTLCGYEVTKPLEVAGEWCIRIEK